MVYLIIEFSRVIFTEPRVFVESRFQKSADQPNGDSGLPCRHWGVPPGKDNILFNSILTTLVIARV